MGYLIGFLGLGFMVVGVLGVGLGNGLLTLLSALMLLACIFLCVLDAVIATSKGAKGNSTFNWVSPLRFARKK